MTGVSVVIPTRNRSKLLAVTLHSVLWQRDVALEVIVVDDASTDDTVAMVRGLGDPRVSVIGQARPQGPSAARNAGSRHAQGSWVGFVDDDDVWAPSKVGRQMSVAEELGRNWVYTGAVNVGAALELVSGGPPPTPEAVLAALPGHNPVPGGGSNVLVRRELLEEVGGFDERLPPCEDWDLWIRLARFGPPAAVAEPLLGYRLHSGSSSLDTGRVLRSARLLEKKHGAPLDWGRIHRWLAESSLRMDRHTLAVSHLARAAVQGEARGVASDLAAILRRRLGRRDQDDLQAGQDWFEHARPWLLELRSADAEAGT
jgi:GT2 family glycosyltransferase